MVGPSNAGSKILNAIIDVFHKSRPMTIVSPSFCGARYRSKLEERTTSKTLPDSWQVVPGFDLFRRIPGGAAFCGACGPV